MASTKSESTELTYPLRTAARLTGLSPELLRAWEKRHGVVTPLRSAGGTRRYTAADINRLSLIKAAVDGGHRISQVAHLEAIELRRLAGAESKRESSQLDEVLDTVNRLDSITCQAVLAQRFSAFGPALFAREFALPLVQEVGERWARGEMGIPQEHMLTSQLRSLLGSAMHPTASSALGPRVIFATPEGEPHELGLLMAALTAIGAGANPLYLGTQLPASDLAAAVKQFDASALAASIVTMETSAAQSYVERIRDELPEHVQLWLGGAGAKAIRPMRATEIIDSLEDFEHRVTLLGLSRATPG
jgi:DNA-binding transcriptional MerR regulator